VATEEPKPIPTEEPKPTEVPTAEPVKEPVELRITWYTDGNEDVVIRELLDKFQAENPHITVILDNVAYNTILENLPIQLEAGEGPDLARVTALGALSKYFLNIKPYVKDPAYWETNFGPFLGWMRPAGDTDGIYGMMTQLTVTGPYINRTLFEQAGIAVPSDTNDSVTWEEWAEVTRQVAEATETDFAMAMDRTGHRLAGPAISQGAKYFGEDGKPVIDDEGFRKMAQLMLDWHADGTMPMDVWAGATGYLPAADFFINGQTVLYMSGSWQIGQFNTKIGTNFDWEAVPNPCGPAACTGMPGGAALVGINTTKHPEEVAMLLDFLAQEDNLAVFSAKTLFIPGHLGLAAKGVEYQTDVVSAKNSLNVFVAQVNKLDPIAYRLQAYAYNTIVNNAIRDRLTQAIVGELTLDEAIQRIQQEINDGLAAAGVK
jgi:alpha-1,4-digalacturonate transport system substrate-binding protein